MKPLAKGVSAPAAEVSAAPLETLRGSGPAPSGTLPRPIICGVRAPLTEASPIEWWIEEALRLGLTVDELKEQIYLADSVINEILKEDK